MSSSLNPSHTKAQVLEALGDLPRADILPPENILFVCKLNRVTCSEDLELIFSRFGKVRSCEVVKDWKTGESLKYAFIEYERVEDCERAYMKMERVVIDDRRIHVDFCQSVSKLWNTWRRGDHGNGRQRPVSQHKERHQRRRSQSPFRSRERGRYRDGRRSRSRGRHHDRRSRSRERFVQRGR